MQDKYPKASVQTAKTKAPELYKTPGLKLLPYFPNNGLEIKPTKLQIPKTNPDCDVSAPLDSASVGKKGGSNDPLIHQMV